MTQASTTTPAYAFRLVAVNAKGERLRLWADVEIDELVCNLTIREAFAIIEGHRSGFRYEVDGGELVTGKAIRNRIHHFRLLHPNGQAEIFTR